MNFDFDLRDLQDFDSECLNENSKKNILNIFNLNKYRYLLNILKDINCDDKSKQILEEQRQFLINQAQLNFKIINSKFSDRIKVGKEYYLCINQEGENVVSLKENFNDNQNIIIGCYKLNEDLTWNTID
tara:strand:- start:1986 stop:2372 length:387 start_codon:yes stop_codon:yes gene_type:complete